MKRCTKLLLIVLAAPAGLARAKTTVPASRPATQTTTRPDNHGKQETKPTPALPGGRTLPVTLKRGLVLHYSFDEKEEDKATDTSGKANHGNLHGTKWTARGKVGPAREFNGKSDYIHKKYDKTSPLFPKNTPFSVVAWFRTSAASPIVQTIVGTHYAGSGSDGYMLAVNSQSHGGKLQWGSGIRGFDIISKAPVNDGKWHHAAGVWDGKQSSLYIDGVLQGTSKASGTMRYSHRASFRVGHLQNNNASPARDSFYYFHGTIDEVGIWNRALGPDEIRAVFALAPGGVHPVARGLVGLWLADGNAKDHLGKHHGTFCGGATCGPGKFGKAFKLDGKDDYVAIGDVLDWGKGSWSACLWYKKTSSSTKGMTLLRKGLTSAGTPKDAGYGLYTLRNRIEFSVCGPSQETTSATGKEPSTNEWHHVAAVLDRKASKVYLYLDGKLAGAKALTGVGNLDTNIPLAVGITDRGRFGRRENPFGGAVDEVAMWKRALSAEEVRQIAQGRSLRDLPMETVPFVTRDHLADRILLIDGKVLKGTIVNETYELTTFFGKIRIAANDVIGLAPAGARVWVLLADGQVAAGSLGDTIIHLKLAEGSPLKVPLAKIRQCGYRISKDRPAEPKPPGLMVYLRSGERLAPAAEAAPKLQLQTPYAKVDLPIGGLLKVESLGGTARTYRAILANGSTLSGTLLPEELTLRLKFGPEAKIGPERILLFIAGGQPAKPADAATMVMRNGNRLHGRVADKTLTVRTEFGEASINPPSVLTMKFAAEKPGAVALKMWSDTDLAGQLVEPELTFSITPGGPTVKPKTTHIASITRTSALPPPEMLKKIEKLIAQLGAESYVDREKAQKALIAMGKSIVPLLKKHLNNPDPEIRQRLEQIIKALGG